LRELARLAGQNVGIPLQSEAPAPVPDDLETSDFEEMLAELRLEFEGEEGTLARGAVEARI
jgi:hypothetical protein